MKIQANVICIVSLVLQSLSSLCFLSVIKPQFTLANIPTDGILILGQDQDAPGGDLDPEQSFSGKIGYFNAWDRKLTDAEIQRIHNCEDLSGGNMASWTTSDWITRYLCAL